MTAVPHICKITSSKVKVGKLLVGGLILMLHVSCEYRQKFWQSENLSHMPPTNVRMMRMSSILCYGRMFEHRTTIKDCY